ncbi:MAG: GTPase Era [Pseudomonadota bacterium]
MSVEDHQTATRAGFVALIGAPNAGKSTLLNRLVGTKLSIVTRKVQTTRAPIRGIAMRGQSQVVFIDTPGIFQPKRRLDRAMVSAAWGGAFDADIVVLLIDAQKGIREDEERILAELDNIKQPKWLVLNKVDAIEPEQLLPLTAELNERVTFDQTFMLSALKGVGCDDLMDALADNLPAGTWFYPEDQLSDIPTRTLAAEITREKLFERLHQELPYSATVETEKWEDQKDGSARIEQVIYVQREGHKKIVLGKNGSTIKSISIAARRDISKLIDRKAHLFLFVKVRENWLDDPERYREMGLEFGN